MFCDITSAVAWAYKGGTLRSIPAGRLLRLLSLRRRTRKASSLLPMHIAGENNAMADIPSRAFKNGEYFHEHENLVTYFNSHFPTKSTGIAPTLAMYYTSSQEFENIDWLQIIKARSNLLCNHIDFTSTLASLIYSFQNTLDLISRLSGRRENVISILITMPKRRPSTLRTVFITIFTTSSVQTAKQVCLFIFDVNSASITHFK